MNFLNSKNKVGSSFILLFSLIYLAAIFEIPVNESLSYDVVSARTLPYCLALVAILVCLLQIFVSAEDDAEDDAEESLYAAIQGFQWQPCLQLTAAMFLYGMSFEFLGFLLATFLFLLVGFAILKEKRYLLSLSVAGGVALFMWLVLTQLFSIHLDSGEVYRMIFGS